MKCRTHQADATAVCVHCGVALCPSCTTKSPSARCVCSQACAEATARAELGLRLILEKATKGHTVSAFFCFLLGGLWILFAIPAFLFDAWPMGLFLGVMALGYIIGGLAYRRAGTKKANAGQPTSASTATNQSAPLRVSD